MHIIGVNLGIDHVYFVVGHPNFALSFALVRSLHPILCPTYFSGSGIKGILIFFIIHLDRPCKRPDGNNFGDWYAIFTRDNPWYKPAHVHDYQRLSEEGYIGALKYDTQFTLDGYPVFKCYAVAQTPVAQTPKA